MKLNVKPFIGQHCETTATGTLLGHIGIELSEPLLFGLGEGLGFIIWNIKTMNIPFMGGRIKQGLITKNIVSNLGLQLEVNETSSKSKAYKMVKTLLDEGKPVGLKLDSYYLEYFTNPFHFAGHFVAIVGYDETDAFLVDTEQQGTEVKTSLSSLEKARSEKGPMSSKNLFYVINRQKEIFPIKEAITKAITNNASTYLNLSMNNLTYKGIYRASDEIIKWFDTSKNIEAEFGKAAMLMERAGTGGSLFRNLYRDFLKEAYELTGNITIEKAYTQFIEIAEDWAEVIVLFDKVSNTQDKNNILEASKLMKEISTKEKMAMELLLNI